MDEAFNDLKRANDMEQFTWDDLVGRINAYMNMTPQQIKIVNSKLIGILHDRRDKNDNNLATSSQQNS